MLQAGKAVKVTIYLSDGAKHHGIRCTRACWTSCFIVGSQAQVC